MKERIKELIAYYLGTEAKGRENATPRRNLRAYLKGLGYNIGDRTLRHYYAEMPFVGYAIDGTKRGIFWIMSKEEAFEVERLRKSQGKACLAHGSNTAKALLTSGQMDLFEGGQDV